MIVVLAVLSVIAPPSRDALPLTVTADASVPIEVRAAAIRAVVRWNTALGERVFQWRVKQPADILVVSLDMLDAAQYVGYWRSHGHGGTIEVRADRQCPDRLERIILHELGHAMGLRHSDAPGPDSVMQAATPNCGKDPRDVISLALVRRAKELLYDR